MLKFKPNEIKQIIFKLAHFDPTQADEYGTQVIDYLVLDALATFEQFLRNSLEVAENIKNNFLLEYEEPEICASAKRLEAKGFIKYIERGKWDRPKFQILQNAKDKLDKNLQKITDLETKVIEEWKIDLEQKYNDYPIVIKNIEGIVDNLQIFTSKIFMKHGVESVALLYPKEEKAKKWFKKVQSDVLDKLPLIDPFIDEILKLEIPNFFKKDDSKRHSYIANLFNASFYWHLIQIDKKCEKLLTKVTRGQKLFLDNNILYSLVGFHGSDILQSVHNLLKIANTLGYNILVTTKTIDEFRYSLNWNKKKIGNKTTITKELLNRALEELGEDSFLTSYWKAIVSEGISIEEFISEKSHLDDILVGLRITKTGKYRKSIEGSEELKDEMSMLRTACGAGISENIIEHDAFHRVLINKARKTPKFNFSEAQAWFLTHDSKLQSYDKFARKGKDYLPFCLMSNQWVQINRPLITRAKSKEDFEKSFHLLVTQPFLRSMVSSLHLEEKYQAVLSRLTRYKNISIPLALKLTTDKRFMYQIDINESNDKIDKTIDSKFVNISVELQKEKDELENVSDTQKERIKKLENRVDEIDQNSSQKGIDYQTKIDTLTGKLSKGKSVNKWLVFLLLFTLSSVFIWNFNNIFNWQWFVIHENKVLIQILSELVAFLALLNIPLKKHWKVWVTLLVPIVVYIISKIGT